MAKTNSEKAIEAVMAVTGQTREEVIEANPGLATSASAATREPRGAGPSAPPILPPGVTNRW